MASYRLAGPLGSDTNNPNLDAGTLVRNESAAPGVIGSDLAGASEEETLPTELYYTPEVGWYFGLPQVLETLPEGSRFGGHEDAPGDDETEDDESKPGNGKKKKPAKRRRRLRGGNFQGAKWLPGLGIVTGKYVPHRRWPFSRSKTWWPFSRSKTKQGPVEWEEVHEKKTVIISSPLDVTNVRLQRDIKDVVYHGNKSYPGGPKGRFDRDPDSAFLYAVPPTVATPRGGTLLEEQTRTTVTGTLRYSLGEKSDKPNFGGKGRVRVTAVDATGAVQVVFDSDWVTTFGEVITVRLNNPPTNVNYILVLSYETWWAGHTEYMYDLNITAQTSTTSKFEVETVKKKRKE